MCLLPIARWTGSLLNKTLRMEMENPVFKKLQDAIEHPCRSKEWFGMAEQAINTIYALGDHPDELCNEIIKKLSRRAFTRKPQPPAPDAPVDEERDPEAMVDDAEPPASAGFASQAPGSQDISAAQGGSLTSGEKDVGDVFHLSQLLFVVGHVAIKHIVFLELVEREWKRQKDEKELGTSRDYSLASNADTFFSGEARGGDELVEQRVERSRRTGSGRRQCRR